MTEAVQDALMSLLQTTTLGTVKFKPEKSDIDREFDISGRTYFAVQLQAESGTLNPENHRIYCIFGSERTAIDAQQRRLLDPKIFLRQILDGQVGVAVERQHPVQTYSEGQLFGPKLETMQYNFTDQFETAEVVSQRFVDSCSYHIRRFEAISASPEYLRLPPGTKSLEYFVKYFSESLSPIKDQFSADETVQALQYIKPLILQDIDHVSNETLKYLEAFFQLLNQVVRSPNIPNAFRLLLSDAPLTSARGSSQNIHTVIVH